MNEKFTPGPWWAFFEGTLDIFVEPGISYKEVCNEAERSQAVANAHLIASAPEMYESNETTLRELENIVSGLDRACGHCDRYLMRGKKVCRNCAAEKARKTAQEMKDRISGLQQKARGEQEE